MTGTEKKIVYMDHAATTYAAPEVVEAMLPYFSEKFGNPSSVYGIGQENKAAVDEARAKVAAAINAEPNEIYFTAGGTESDNWALKGVAFANIRKGKPKENTSSPLPLSTTPFFMPPSGFSRRDLR